MFKRYSHRAVLSLVSDIEIEGMILLSTELLAYYRCLSTQLFTVVDVETTGHRARHNRVMELSVLQATLADGIHRQQTHLINPQEPIPPKIVEVTGISEEMVSVASPAAEVFPLYVSWLNQGILTAHNIKFDYPFLRAEYARLETNFYKPASERFCTVELARLMLADLPSRSLPKLVKHFQFQVGVSHRAEADTQACWLLAERLLHEICNEDDETLIARFARHWMPLKEAAKLLRRSKKQCQSLMTELGVESRFSGRRENGFPMYRRGDVEAIFYDRQGGCQLSLI
ncbi:MAG: 3'-5' exonuclease [Elainellaceae cyanobacterium]